MRHTLTPQEELLESLGSALDALTQDYAPEQRDIITSAAELYWPLRHETSSYPDPLLVAMQLQTLKADAPTLVAALLGSDVCQREYPTSSLTPYYDKETIKLVESVRRLNTFAISSSPQASQLVATQDQAEKLRRMLLSMVSDVRAMLVKLSYRTQRLRNLVNYPREEALCVAQETLDIFAPLANRLGLGQLKWEMEDLCFRVLEPAAYKRTASALEESRAAREQYVQTFVEDFQASVRAAGFSDAKVFGRPKHIYSIWKKMRNKKVEFKDLFDVRAVRVLVESEQQCYGVLGLAHTAWQPIVREFDDYIANPKENGYQSLHTAVIGPQGKAVEIQIRTFAMENEAELGVAAHWSYKEGAGVDRQMQKSINSWRQLLEDNDDAALLEDFSQQIVSERVYVFTPKGDVVDLVAGATPLDFAYHVHSQIGHRCRGAKVNGSIVTLTTKLVNGDQVEVLTAREGSPSRDWLNKSLGFLHSARARTKVRAWFNLQDHEQHLLDGRAILDREIKRAHANISIEKLTREFKLNKPADLCVALARNDISVSQLATTINLLESPLPAAPVTRSLTSAPATSSEQINVQGVGSLLTQMANCCKPVPYDSIVGFITKGKGVSVHRADCKNMLCLPEQDHARLIEVSWGDENAAQYLVDIAVVAYDRQGLLRDVSTVLANARVDVASVNTLSNIQEQIAEMKLSVYIDNIQSLANLLDKLRQLRNVQSALRVI